MAFNVGALSAYTDQQKYPLLIKSLFEAKTQRIFTPQTGIKSADTLNIIDTDLILQLGGTCGWNSSGTTTLSQRTLTVGLIKVNESLCQKTLQAYYIQKQLNPGSMQEDPAQVWAKQYSELKAGQTSQACEQTMWYGDTNSNVANAQRFDGQLKLIDAASASTIKACATNTDVLSATNIIAKMDEASTNIPAQLLGKGDFVFFVGWDVFRFLVTAIKNANYFHYDPGTSWNEGEVMLPGSNIKVIAVNGLNLSSRPVDSVQSSTIQRFIGSRLSNFFVGTDMENEEEKFEIFYAREAMETRYVAEFKLGTQFAFPAEIIQYGK